MNWENAGRAMKINEAILDINLDVLEIEAARQPKLIYKFSKVLAKKKTELNNLQKDIDLTHAQLTKIVRKKPGKFGLTEKPTESAIKSIILTISKYTDKLTLQNEIQYEIDILKGVLNGLEHKKRMIEVEVTLHGQNYYSTPYIKNETWKQLVGDEDKRSLAAKGIKRKKKKKVRKKK